MRPKHSIVRNSVHVLLVLLPKNGVVRHHHQPPTFPNEARGLLVVRELMADHAKNGVNLPGLHGSRRVEINCHQLFGKLRVAVREGPELPLATQASAERTEREPSHLKNNTCSIKEMLDERFVARINDIGHGEGAGRRGGVPPPSPTATSSDCTASSFFKEGVTDDKNRTLASSVFSTDVSEEFMKSDESRLPMDIGIANRAFHGLTRSRRRRGARPRY